MTRVTAPREIARLTRALSSTAVAPRPSRLPICITKTAVLRIRKELERQQDAAASERAITTSHRPIFPTPNPNRVIPLMQGFHTTTQHPQRPSQAETPTTPHSHPMDFAVLPSADDLLFTPSSFSSSPSTPAFTTVDQVRVPLLPDNFAPARSPDLGHPAEAPDAPLAAPEIVVLAADPSRADAVSPLSEVEGMGPDGAELLFVHGSGARLGAGGASGAEGEFAGGMLRGLWDGIVGDVLGGGGAQGKAKPAV